METGENSQGLHSALEFSRFVSIALLLLHFYYIGYDAFDHWQLTTKISDRLLSNIAGTGIFEDFDRAKIISLGFLIIVLIGARGRKNDKIKWKNCLVYMIVGLILFFISELFWQLQIEIEEKINLMEVIYFFFSVFNHILDT